MYCYPFYSVCLIFLRFPNFFIPSLRLLARIKNMTSMQNGFRSCLLSVLSQFEGQYKANDTLADFIRKLGGSAKMTCGARCSLPLLTMFASTIKFPAFVLCPIPRYYRQLSQSIFSRDFITRFQNGCPAL